MNVYFRALPSVNMLFSKTGSFIAPFIQKLISSTSLFFKILKWCCVTVWLPVTTTSCSYSHSNFYVKLDLLLVLIFVKSSIDVHQIARKSDGKIKCSIHVVQVCFRLADAGKTVMLRSVNMVTQDLCERSRFFIKGSC